MGYDNNLREHFEAILGREVGETGDEVLLRELVGAYYRTEGGHRTSREIGTTGDSTKGCGAADVLTIAGLVVTGADGTTERLLSDFHCETINVLQPSLLVATPRGRNPVFVTTSTSRVETAGRADLRMEFRTWSAGGDPVPRIAVSWHCITTYEQLFVVPD